ncbi:MAG: hypothetical protein WD266_06565 [Balneolales bacterium]
MTHQPEKKGFDLFSRRKHLYRDSSELNPGLYQRIQSLNWLHLVSAVIQMVSGFTVAGLAVLQLTGPSWAASVLGLMGCTLVFTGMALLYSTVKARKSVNNMLKETIQRVIREQN